MGMKKVLLSLLHDVVMISLGLFVMIALKKLMPLTKRGGFCNDFSIRYPSKVELIPSSVETTVFGLLIIFTVTIVEFLRCLDQRDWEYIVPSKYIVMVFRIEKSLVSMIFHGLILASIVFFGKMFVGRLRPNFIRICNTIPCDVSGYQDFECRKYDEAAFDARLSFPSGHAAIAWYAAAYIVLYVQYGVRCWPLVKALIEVAVISMAWFSSLCRITQNQHHPSDVVCSALLGLLFALLAYWNTSHSLPLPSSDENKAPVQRSRAPVHMINQ